MVIKIQAEVYVILLILVVLCSLMIYIGNQIKKSDPAKAPKGIANVGILLVSMIDNFTGENMGEPFKKNFGPYIGSLACYLTVANLIGLLGLPTPTSNFSVTLSLALISWLIIEGVSIKANTVKGYLKGFLEPVFLFLPVNIFGEIAPLVSMSLRLFGNLLVGSVLMTLVYVFTGYVSSFIPLIGRVNFIGPLVAPVLHAYFDVFAGFIQMFIFISLTTILAGNKAAVD
ncbi:MAG: F0F1 ATP synthase subunit A [Erysipelotrichaceae bacterium]|nr:F0F1 ATP synthase subunit A [Erysipelotrichaceae bacterium]